MMSAAFLAVVLVMTNPEYPERHLEPSTEVKGWSVAEVQSWVHSIGFPEYSEAFAERKVDGRKLLKLNSDRLASDLLLAAPEHCLIIQMELQELKYRRGLMSGSEQRAHRRKYPLAEEWSTDEVGSFLKDQGLGQYAPNFLQRQIDGRRLLGLTDATLHGLLQTEPNPIETNEQAFELLSAELHILRARSGIPRSSHDEL